jgi:hypothetical protein
MKWMIFFFNLPNPFSRTKSWVLFKLECVRGVKLTTLPPCVILLSRYCGILNISQPYRPPRPVTGINLLDFTVPFTQFFLQNTCVTASSDFPLVVLVSRHWTIQDNQSVSKVGYSQRVWFQMTSFKSLHSHVLFAFRWLREPWEAYSRLAGLPIGRVNCCLVRQHSQT